MFKKSLGFVLVLILGAGAFSGTSADESTEKYKYYVYGAATIVGTGTAVLVAGSTDNQWAIYGSGVGGFLVTCLVADLVRLAFRRPDTADTEGQQRQALKVLEHLQIGSSLDGNTTYAGLRFGL